MECYLYPLKDEISFAGIDGSEGTASTSATKNPELFNKMNAAESFEAEKTSWSSCDLCHSDKSLWYALCGREMAKDVIIFHDR